jgi:hypothetical protein
MIINPGLPDLTGFGRLGVAAASSVHSGFALVLIGNRRNDDAGDRRRNYRYHFVTFAM